MISARIAIWRRCLATASRRDRRRAQERGIFARELLERRGCPGVGGLSGRGGTWLVPCRQMVVVLVGDR